MQYCCFHAMSLMRFRLVRRFMGRRSRLPVKRQILWLWEPVNIRKMWFRRKGRSITGDMDRVRHITMRRKLHMQQIRIRPV